MTYDFLRLDVTDGVGRLTFCRPDRGNAVNELFAGELNDVAIRCDEDDSVRCLLIEAEGRWFSTGGDLAALGASREAAPAFVKRTTTTLHSALSRLSRMAPPVVVSMRGSAIGAGASFAAAADFTLVTPKVRFLSGFTAIGMTVDSGLTWFLPRRVGTRAAADYLLRAREWSADEALLRGLVTEIVDDASLDQRAIELATELAQGPTLAYGEIKNLLLSTWDQPLETQLELEARALARATRTHDGWRGIESAMAGQRPTYEGR
jgi:2-(1,2-epoxy-1,2-dihydrophenyl)acetyl-CoA isomerase